MTLLLGLGLGYIGMVLCATAVRSITEISWHELEEQCRRQKRTELFSLIYDIRERFQIGAEIFQQLLTASWLTAGLTLWLANQPTDSIGFLNLATPILLACLLLVLGNTWIPWAIARNASVGFVYRTWRWWYFVGILALPIIAVGDFISNLLARARGDVEEEIDEEEAFEDEILSMVSEAEQDGFIESEARDMIEGIIELGDTDVRSVMTPRSRVDAVHINTRWDDMVAKIVDTGRTRLPVYRDSIDHVVGLLYAKDLLKESLRPEAKRRSLTKFMRAPLFVPEQTRLDEMLNQFLHCRTHMAVIQDEYGGLAGVVTIEDILEEIVGEIVDETDKEKATDITILNDYQADVAGTVYIYQLNAEMGLDLPENESYDTVSGLIMNQIKEIPRPGHELVVGSVQFNILDANRRQILSVRVTRPREEED